jgi:hypothetical protein
MTRTPRRRKIILVVAGILIAAISLGAFRAYRFIDYGFESPRLAVLPSPDGNRSAYLIWHGALMAHTLTFLVSPSNSQDDLQWIGSVDSDDSLRFAELVWSRNSSLVVARCTISGYNEKLPEGVSDDLFTHGYDFSTSNRFVPARDVFDSPEGWMTRHGELERLLQDNGGGLTVVSGYDLPKKMRKMSWREWRQWRRGLRKAKDATISHSSIGRAPVVRSYDDGSARPDQSYDSSSRLGGGGEHPLERSRLQRTHAGRELVLIPSLLAVPIVGQSPIGSLVVAD